MTFYDQIALQTSPVADLFTKSQKKADNNTLFGPGQRNPMTEPYPVFREDEELPENLNPMTGSPTPPILDPEIQYKRVLPWQEGFNRNRWWPEPEEEGFDWSQLVDNPYVSTIGGTGLGATLGGWLGGGKGALLGALLGGGAGYLGHRYYDNQQSAVS